MALFAKITALLGFMLVVSCTLVECGGKSSKKSGLLKTAQVNNGQTFNQGKGTDLR